MKQRFTTRSAVPSPGTQSVRRATALLRTLGAASGELGLTDLAVALELHKTTVFRLLGALEEDEMVVRDAERETYRLGPALVSLGCQARRSVGLHEAARPVLRALADETGETATLEVLVGDEVFIVDEIHGRFFVGASPEVGTRWPAPLTSTGKVLLAARDQPGGSALDHAVAFEELEPGFGALGAPVRNADDRVIAAVSVGGPTTRLTREILLQLAPTVRAAAARISQRLGAPPHMESPG
jgi:DNA-binding IclR family transcriptional regulator